MVSVPQVVSWTSVSSHRLTVRHRERGDAKAQEKVSRCSRSLAGKRYDPLHGVAFMRGASPASGLLLEGEDALQGLLGLCTTSLCITRFFCLQEA